MTLSIAKAIEEAFKGLVFGSTAVLVLKEQQMLKYMNDFFFFVQNEPIELF